MSLRKTPRTLIVAGLLVSALAWVGLVGVTLSLFGSRAATGGAPPTDDGSVKAKLTSLDRGKDFEISVSAHITDKAGQTLPGLTQQDFEVYENGKLVDTGNFLPAGKGAIRLCLVVDYSTSMAGRKIVEARKAARALLRMLRDKDDYIGLYFFNDALFDRKQAERLNVAPLDLLRREEAWEALMFTNVGNGSPMMATMDLGLTSLASVPGRRVMIVLTDGMDTGEPAELNRLKETLLEHSRDLKIPLYMVSMSTEHADREAMQGLAEATGGTYYEVPEPQQLKEIFEKIGRSLQDDYTFTYYSPTPVEDGRKRNVHVVVRSGSVGTTTTGDYSVPGVIATGGETTSDVQENATSPFAVFGALAGLLGGLMAVPFVIRPRRGSAAAPVQPVAAAVPVKSAASTPAPRPGSSAARPKAKVALGGEQPPARQRPR